MGTTCQPSDRQTDRWREGGKEEVFRAWNHATCAYRMLLCLKFTDVQWSVPCYLLAVRRPVPDVVVLLLHAVFDPHAAAWAAHGAATRTQAGAGAQPGAAVRHQVVRSHVGASALLGGVPTGAKLLLRRGAVLRRQPPPPVAAGHWRGSGEAKRRLVVQTF